MNKVQFVTMHTSLYNKTHYFFTPLYECKNTYQSLEHMLYIRNDAVHACVCVRLAVCGNMCVCVCVFRR